MQKVDLVGQTFGRLAVVGFAGSRKVGASAKRKRFWLCRCECGNATEVPTDSLRQGNTQSCGCLRADFCREAGKSTRPRLPKGEPGFNALFTRYKRAAADRNLSFELTKDVFRRFTQLDCYYCGKSPETEITGRSASGHVIENSRYVYNGIDRLDPTIGYELANCVTACKDCNLAKQSLSYPQFLRLVDAVYNNRILNQTRIAN